MIQIGSNLTYTGFVHILNNKDAILEKIEMAGCSQLVWQATSKNYGTGPEKIVYKIKFYCPNDWLLPIARNEVFLKNWCKLASDWFYPVKYLGKFEAKDAGIATDYVKKPSENEEVFIYNQGDQIMTDLWRGFEMEVGEYGESHKKAMPPYAAFCFIRYLYANHYWGVIIAFMHLIKYKKSQTLPDLIDEFTLFQISHYYSAEHVGYSGGHGFMKYITRDQNCQKLVTLAEFQKRIKANNSLNNSFGLGSAASLTRTQVEKYLSENSFKAIYEGLK